MVQQHWNQHVTHSAAPS